MKCLICGGESAGEVCNKCIRLEKIIYQKEWAYKEGMLLKKTEDFRIAISNLRISGRVSICDNPKGLNARIDNVSHYLMNVKECTQTTFQNKKTLMIVIEGSQPGSFARYCFLPGFEYGDQLVNAIFDAKQKAASLTERIRQNNGLPVETSLEDSKGFQVSNSEMNIINMDEEEKKAPTPAPAPAPRPVAPTPAPAPAPTPAPASTATSYDTVALANIADDISEFETKIKKLKVLRDNGILSEEEYQAEKKKLVSIF